MATLVKSRISEIRKRCEGKSRVSLSSNDLLALTDMASSFLRMKKQASLVLRKMDMISNEMKNISPGAGK